MPITFVTGPAGAGKTELCKELISRGHEAHDTDDPKRAGIAGWHNLQTGEYVAGFNEVPVTQDFLKNHVWNLTEDAIVDYKNRAAQDRIYLCGALPNPEQVLGIASAVGFLLVDSGTIRDRLTERSKIEGEVEWGREEWQILRSIERNTELKDNYYRLGATFIDATQAVSRVADAVESIGT